jgi:hypothetical protein
MVLLLLPFQVVRMTVIKKKGAATGRTMLLEGRRNMRVGIEMNSLKASVRPGGRLMCCIV